MLPAYRKILVIKQERAQKRNSTEKADLVAGDGQGEFLRRICIHLNPCYPWGKGSEKIPGSADAETLLDEISITWHYLGEIVF